MQTRKRSNRCLEPNGEDDDQFCNNTEEHEFDSDVKPEKDITQLARKKKAGQANPSRKIWTMILPEKIATLPIGDNEMQNGVFCKLPHPRTSTEALFMFFDKEVYEVIKFKENFRSWFVDDAVQKDGSLIMTSPIDPLLLAIPYLVIAGKMNKFTTIDQILIDKKYTHIRKLEQCLTNEDLCKVCDFKGSDDLLVYRLNEDRLMSWLTLKVEKLSKYLKTSNVHVANGARVSTLIRSSKDSDIREGDYCRYAFGLVSDYLPPNVQQRLKDRLQLTDNFENETIEIKSEPPPKKQRTDSNVNQASIDDYRDFNTSKGTSSKAPTLTTAQKKLAKIDKSGMKALTSFFTTKTK